MFLFENDNLTRMILQYLIGGYDKEFNKIGGFDENVHSIKQEY